MKEMDAFLDTSSILKLNKEERSDLNRSIAIHAIEAIITSPLRKKIPRPCGFTAEFYKKFQKDYNTPQIIP